MIPWLEITRFGDLVVTAPAAAAITVWLAMGRAWRLAAWWWILFIGGMALVVATKIAFIGWGLGIRPLDFTGISGHAMRATAVYPVLFYLALLHPTPWLRMLSIAAGLSVAILIDISRVLVHAHSISEVVAGFLLGGLISVIFLRGVASIKALPVAHWVLAAGLLGVILSASSLKPAPTERWVEHMALALSGHDRPYTRSDWQAQSGSFQ